MPGFPAQLTHDFIPESTLLEDPVGGRHHKRIRVSDVDPQRAAYVEDIVARLLLKKMAAEKEHEE
jgi:hypothetical protein